MVIAIILLVAFLSLRMIFLYTGKQPQRGHIRMCRTKRLKKNQNHIRRSNSVSREGRPEARQRPAQEVINRKKISRLKKSIKPWEVPRAIHA